MVNFLSENLFLKDIFAECKRLGCQLYFPQYITPMSLAPIVKTVASLKIISILPLAALRIFSLFCVCVYAVLP